MKRVLITLVFINPKMNFSTKVPFDTEENIKKKFLGNIYNFGFKGLGRAACTDVIFEYCEDINTSETIETV